MTKQEFIIETGGSILKCFNCGTCTGSCPSARISGHNPRKIIRKILLGFDVSEDIWLCSSCFSCNARCPNGIDIAGIIDSVKIKALKNKKKNRAISLNKAFLNSIRKYGRVHETGLMAEFNMNSLSVKSSLENLNLARRFLLRNKLNLTPHKIKNIGRIKNIFEKVGEIEEIEKAGETENTGQK